MWTAPKARSLFSLSKVFNSPDIIHNGDVVQNWKYLIYLRYLKIQINNKRSCKERNAASQRETEAYKLILVGNAGFCLPSSFQRQSSISISFWQVMNETGASHWMSKNSTTVKMVYLRSTVDRVNEDGSFLHRYRSY